MTYHIHIVISPPVLPSTTNFYNKCNSNQTPFTLPHNFHFHVEQQYYVYVLHYHIVVSKHIRATTINHQLSCHSQVITSATQLLVSLSCLPAMVSYRLWNGNPNQKKSTILSHSVNLFEILVYYQNKIKIISSSCLDSMWCGEYLFM